MGACYNTILVPAADLETVISAIGDAVRRLGYRTVHREEPATYEDGFHYRSVQMIFVGPCEGSRWVPLSSWGDGLPCGFPEWYRTNPLAQSLSVPQMSPVVYLFSYNAGSVAGYSIFKDGQQVEAQSLTPNRDWPLKEFSPPVAPPAGTSLLADLLGEPRFDFVTFMREFEGLEVGMAALAARLGVSVHLIDPLDIQDGEGAVVIEDGKYNLVSLRGWVGVFYDKATA